MKTIMRILLASSVLVCLNLAFALPTPQSKQLTVKLEPAYETILADTRQTIPIRIELKGFEKALNRERKAVNVSLVLDRSGSMTGRKLEQAKNAAITALELLHPRDIISVVTYESAVKVVVPATRLNDRSTVINSIRQIRSAGSTALFSGVSQGAGELRKFLERNQVNRVILLSDGIANVGPSSPGDLAELGESLAREGISVTTIGLGLDYNEELMTRLAARSDGNHAFVENPTDLARIFRNEFGDLVNVVAKDIKIEIDCLPGFTPRGLVGRDADIYGQKIVTSLGQIYASQNRSLILEVDATSHPAGTSTDVARVRISYNNVDTGQQDNLEQSVRLTFSSSQKDVTESLNKKALVDFNKQKANLVTEKAIKLRDQGRPQEAAQLLSVEAQRLRGLAGKYNSNELGEDAARFDSQSDKVQRKDWSRQKKQLFQENYEQTIQNEISK